MSNFLAQSILSIHQSQLFESVPGESSDTIISFVKENKERVSRYSAACLQVLNTRTQHTANYIFPFLHIAGYISRKNGYYVEIDSLRLQHMMEVYENLYATDSRCDCALSRWRKVVWLIHALKWSNQSRQRQKVYVTSTTFSHFKKHE